MSVDVLRNLAIGLICMFFSLLGVGLPLIGHRIGIWYSKAWRELDKASQNKLTTRRFVLVGFSLLVGVISLLIGWLSGWSTLTFLGFCVGSIVLPVLIMLLEYYIIYKEINSGPPTK